MNYIARESGDISQCISPTPESDVHSFSRSVRSVYRTRCVKVEVCFRRMSAKHKPK